SRRSIVRDDFRRRTLARSTRRPSRRFGRDNIQDESGWYGLYGNQGIQWRGRGQARRAADPRERWRALRNHRELFQELQFWNGVQAQPGWLGIRSSQDFCGGLQDKRERRRSTSGNNGRGFSGCRVSGGQRWSALWNNCPRRARLWNLVQAQQGRQQFPNPAQLRRHLLRRVVS